MLSHLIQYEFLDLFVSYQIFDFSFINTKSFGQSLKSIKVWVNDCNIKVLQTITVNKALGNIRTTKVNVFNLFRCDILSLTQFVNVFLPVNDFQSSVGQNDSNIATVVPTIFIDCLFGVLFIQIIPFEDRVASHTDLPSRRIVRRKVVHLWYIDKLKFYGSIRASHMTITSFTFKSYKCSTWGFRLTISFTDITL